MKTFNVGDNCWTIANNNIVHGKIVQEIGAFGGPYYAIEKDYTSYVRLPTGLFTEKPDVEIELEKKILLNI